MAASVEPRCSAWSRPIGVTTAAAGVGTTFVAFAGAEVVGYAKLSLSEALPDIAYHDMTGVKRAWRGRGIASALKRAEIAWAIDAGYAKLQTFNEMRNEPIRVLNERHGYVVEPGAIRVRGALLARAVHPG